MEQDQLSPRQYMKSRHPDRFSDTRIEAKPHLDRSLLEYHLETLTSRKQETAFERFALKLAEREICPNLLPQTGPTGGGDSKVDTETYPVADRLSMLWHVGTGREAASERWGFAFSAKKKWKPKLEADIAKLVGTGRDYRKAFFVTSQYVRDQERGKVEDELSKKHCVEVRILDRTWILDKVFEHGHSALAIEELEIGLPAHEEAQKGLDDVRRERRVEELERRIQEAALDETLGRRMVGDCLEAAITSAELERPRSEVDGLFERARRVAAQYGSTQDELESAYHSAWMTFWWFEDYGRAAELTGMVEKLVKGTKNVRDLELLSNLWMLLRSAVLVHGLDARKAGLESVTETLSSGLDAIARERGRPSAALQARTLQLHMEMQFALGAGQSIDRMLAELRDIVLECEGLAGYPLRQLAAVVTDLGPFLGASADYDALFEAVVEVSGRREGEIAAAGLLVQRGEQQLEAEDAYGAISTIGRGLRRLYREESRRELIYALHMCSHAYETVGLLWAARGVALTAAALAVHDLTTYGNVTLQQAGCFSGMKWLELRLGRVVQSVAWHEVDTTVKSALTSEGYDPEKLHAGDAEYDEVLAGLLLRTDLTQLRTLHAWPSVLEGLGLYRTSMALLYALGHEDALEEEPYRSFLGEEDAEAVLRSWAAQEALSELPDRPSLYDGGRVVLESGVLGCRISVGGAGEGPCVEVSESLLGLVEAVLSTGTFHGLMAMEPALTVEVEVSDSAEAPFACTLEERLGRPHLDVQCQRFDPNNLSMEEQEAIQRKLLEAMAMVAASILVSGEAERRLEGLLGEEKALERSLGFTGSFVSAGNVLGHDAKLRVEDWRALDGQDYPLVRAHPWGAGEAIENNLAEKEDVERRLGQGEPPPEVADYRHRRHSDMHTVSPIRGTLWDKAEWRGAAFLTTPYDPSPPVLAPVFGNREAAEAIWEGWRSEIGNRDERDEVRIAIVRGVDVSKPHAYTIVVGANPDTTARKQSAVFCVSRVRVMEPESSLNLDMFLVAFEAEGCYLLAPAVADEEMSEVEVLMEHAIMKLHVHVRQAWEVGRNDIDLAGIIPERQPLIPDGVNDAPVIEVLRWRHDSRIDQG